MTIRLKNTMAIALLLVMLISTSAQAASVWNKATNNQSWMEPTNWTPSGVPNGPNVEASLTHNFTGTSTAGTNIALNGNVELGTLIGGDSTPSSPGPPPVYQNVTVVPGTPTTSTLTFNVSTGSAMITSNSNGGGRLNFSNVPVVLMDPLLITWGGNASNLNFQAGSVVSTGVGAGVTGITIQGSDAGVNGDLSLSPVFFGAANTYNGDLTINGGRVVLQNLGGVPATTSVFVNSAASAYSRFDLNVNTGGTYAINGLNGNGFVNHVSTDTNGPTLLQVGSSNGNGNFSGILRIQPPNGVAPGTRVFNLEKKGTGVQVLSGANTYNGITTVSAGTLIVNGTHKTVTGGDTDAIPDTYIVVSGATLGGSGIIEPSVNLSGTLSPGGDLVMNTLVDTPDTLTLGGLTLSGTVTGSYEIDALGGASDFVDLGSGMLDLSANPNVTFNVSVLNGTFLADGIYNLIHYGDITLPTGGSAVYSGPLNGLQTATISWTSEDGEGFVQLELHTIPEPSTIALSLLAMAGVMLRGRVQQRMMQKFS